MACFHRTVEDNESDNVIGNEVVNKSGSYTNNDDRITQSIKVGTGKSPSEVLTLWT